jgi:hypothetical protein
MAGAVDLFPLSFRAGLALVFLGFGMIELGVRSRRDRRILNERNRLSEVGPLRNPLKTQGH